MTALNKASFHAVCEYIETSGKFEFTLPELRNQMKDNCLFNEMLYANLREKYGSDIYILQKRGTQTIIYYKFFDIGDMSKKFYKGEDLLEPEKRTLYKVVAELLKKDIKQHEHDNKSYPPGVDFLESVDHDIPESLLNFIGLLIESEHHENFERFKMKRATIAHAIITSVRTQSFVSKLQLAVGTYVYRKTGSRQVIDLLAKMGISASYHHLLQFETSVVLNPPEMVIENGVHVQHVFDNTDHNVATLDGKETFHCLGGIAIYTPESDVVYEGRIARVTERSSATSVAVARKSRIQPIPYTYQNAKGLEAVKYIDISTLDLPASSRLPPTYSVYFWAKSLGIPKLPNWSGFMEVLSQDEIPIVSRVVCLPFINEPPSNVTTINTALHYALSEAHKLNQTTCFVTFDQPLYHKARTIVAESQENGQLNDVVVRLGGFHLLMSYLGAVGYIMNGSGLDGLWSTVYAPQSVKHMLSGHAYSRAMRAHILTVTALGITICKTMESDKTEQYRTHISSFLEKWHADPPEPPTIGDCRADQTVADITEDFIAQIDSLKNNGPTAQLWLQYFELVIIALQFVEAERLGDWQLHLQTVKKMLPVFHAAGHLPYAKSAQLYLQDMAKLDLDLMDDEGYQLFSKEGYFTVRRTDKTWAGIWTDMTIEQTLNRHFGTDLKHGRGVTPGVVARYLMAMPTMFCVMTAVEEYFQIETSSSEQHKDLGNSRQKRDENELGRFLSWINERKPFESRPQLISLVTGVIGGSEINCHLAIERGEQLMLGMVGKNAKDVSLSMSNRVKTLESAKAGMHVGGAMRIKVDSTQLFHRISVVFKGDEQKQQKAFDYELSPFPLALFDDKGFMRKTPKSELFKIFKPYKIPPVTLEEFMRNFTFVIDGGFLLHNVTWPHGSTYSDLFELYRMHILSHYRGNAWVVFDGYNNEVIGTKSYERYRRNENNVAADITITPDMLVTLTQAKFLSNVVNKFKFVELLAAYLTQNGINVKVAQEDADTLIVKTAIAVNNLVDGPVAVVGNDTDLFVLLIASTTDRQSIYLYKKTTRKSQLYSTADHNNLKEFVLFAHAFVGCDTTSALHGKGKKTIFNLLQKNTELREHCRVFYQRGRSTDELLNVAKKFIFHLYGFENGAISLGHVRYVKYEASAVSNTTVMRLSSLPPTEAALEEHSKRVYLQIQTWLGNILRPEDWGWQRSAFLLLPIMTKQSPAPEELLNMVFCSCTTDCSGSRCKCKKSGMPCSRYCKNCNGVSCRNSPRVRIDFSADNDVEDVVDEFNIAEDDLAEFDEGLDENMENDDARDFETMETDLEFIKF